MIIVSQDKSGIVNFDEVFRLYADNWSDEDFPMEPNCFCIRAEKSGDHMTSVFLGEYETMKRAKEVLQEIIESYENCNASTVSTGYGYVKNKVYEMPTE